MFHYTLLPIGTYFHVANIQSVRERPGVFSLLKCIGRQYVWLFLMIMILCQVLVGKLSTLFEIDTFNVLGLKKSGW